MATAPSPIRLLNSISGSVEWNEFIVTLILWAWQDKERLDTYYCCT